MEYMGQKKAEIAANRRVSARSMKTFDHAGPVLGDVFALVCLLGSRGRTPEPAKSFGFEVTLTAPRVPNPLPKP